MYLETERKRYRNFTRTNDIDILDFLEMAFEIFLGFFLEEWGVGRYSFFKEVSLYVSTSSFMRDQSKERKSPSVKRELLLLK